MGIVCVRGIVHKQAIATIFEPQRHHRLACRHRELGKHRSSEHRAAGLYKARRQLAEGKHRAQGVIVSLRQIGQGHFAVILGTKLCHFLPQRIGQSVADHEGRHRIVAERIRAGKHRCNAVCREVKALRHGADPRERCILEHLLLIT